MNLPHRTLIITLAGVVAVIGLASNLIYLAHKPQPATPVPHASRPTSNSTTGTAPVNADQSNPPASTTIKWSQFRSKFPASVYSSMTLEYPSSWTVGESPGDFAAKENEFVVNLSFDNYAGDIETQTQNGNVPFDYEGVSLLVYYSQLELDQYISEHYTRETQQQMANGGILLRDATRINPIYDASPVHILLKNGAYVYDLAILGTTNPGMINIINHMAKTLVPIKDAL